MKFGTGTNINTGKFTLRITGDTDSAEAAKRTVQQRDSAFISLVCRSEDQVEKRFTSRKCRGKREAVEARADLFYVNRTSWGRKEKDQGKRTINQT